MKKIVVCLVVFVVLFAGCTGSFKATRAIHNWHSSQENKWVDEALFLVVVIIPVYGVAMLIDGVIFNSVEFWTGKNPLTASIGNTPDKDIVLERSAMGVVAKDKTGAVLYTSMKDSSGSVSVYDSELNLVEYFSPEDVVAFKEKHL